MTFEKHHETFQHRTENEIQEKIVEVLERFPRSTYAVAKDIGADKRTALLNLRKLEKLGRVQKRRWRLRPTFWASYWNLKSTET